MAGRERRLKEIECDLIKFEIQVWEELDQEQQASVDAQREKLAKLTEEVLAARSVFDEKLCEFKANLLPSEGLVRRELVSEYQQTESVEEVDEDLLDVELESLREEVRGLQADADLMEEWKRLEREPREGERFKRVRAARLREEKLTADLDRKIAQLEAEIRAAEGEHGNTAFSEWTAPKPSAAATAWDGVLLEPGDSEEQVHETRSSQRPPPANARPWGQRERGHNAGCWGVNSAGVSAAATTQVSARVSHQPLSSTTTSSAVSARVSHQPLSSTTTSSAVSARVSHQPLSSTTTSFAMSARVSHQPLSSTTTSSAVSARVSHQPLSSTTTSSAMSARVSHQPLSSTTTSSAMSARVSHQPLSSTTTSSAVSARVSHQPLSSTTTSSAVSARVSHQPLSSTTTSSAVSARVSHQPLSSTTSSTANFRPRFVMKKPFLSKRQ